MKDDEQRVVDHADGLRLGPLDVVGALLTLPLLFWALMFAVTGAEHLVATPEARLRLYLVLLGTEVLLAAVIAVLVLR